MNIRSVYNCFFLFCESVHRYRLDDLHFTRSWAFSSISWYDFLLYHSTLLLLFFIFLIYFTSIIHNWRHSLLRICELHYLFPFLSIFVRFLSSPIFSPHPRGLLFLYMLFYLFFSITTFWGFPIIFFHYPGCTPIHLHATCKSLRNLFLRLVEALVAVNDLLNFPRTTLPMVVLLLTSSVHSRSVLSYFQGI